MSDDEEDTHCPLCVEEMDVSDKNFIPCPCGYRVCQTISFCFTANIYSSVSPTSVASLEVVSSDIYTWFMLCFRCTVTRFPLRCHPENGQRPLLCTLCVLLLQIDPILWENDTFLTVLAVAIIFNCIVVGMFRLSKSLFSVAHIIVLSCETVALSAASIKS